MNFSEDATPLFYFLPVSFTICSMEQDQSQKLLSVRNLFLYLVIVITPIAVAYTALSTMIEEQYKARLALVQQDLDQQSAKLNLIIKDEYQLKNFFNTLMFDKNLINQSPETIAAVINRIDELYPDAFKWLFLDEQLKTRHIVSRNLIHGRRHWEMLIQNILARISSQKFPDVILDDVNYQKRFYMAQSTLQKTMGSATKIEHLYWAKNNPTELRWFGQKCLIIWDTDTISVSSENIPEKIRGGCMMVAFPEKLPENFWIERLVIRRKYLKDNISLPMAAINLTHRKMIVADPQLKNINNVEALLNSYNRRHQNAFQHEEYLIKANTPDNDSQLRILSFASLKTHIEKRKSLHRWLLLFVISLIFLATFLAVYVHHNGFKNTTLRKRIAAIFIVAILMPILSLISIGKSFVEHEETRLIESAYVKMRSSIEALELRYKDASRLFEAPLFKQLNELIAEKPLTVKSINEAMESAKKLDLIQNFVFIDEKGKTVATNWPHIDPAIKKTLELTATKMLVQDKGLMEAENQSILKSAIDDEVEEILTNMKINMDFSRPSHLRYFAYQDQHMYFMAISVRIDNRPFALFVYLPDYYLERSFCQREFAMNIPATGDDSEAPISRPELSFYSTLQAHQHIPSESDLWKKLKDSFKRAYSLRIEDSGRVTIDGEEFLYLIKPLSSMHRQSYLPCLLTSTTDMRKRLRDLSLVVAGLALTATFGAVMLSLILAGSLLGPISQIDQAAQKIGKGDLSVVLPKMGEDEIGRLSQTFNDMVKGLREREKMQAYVSDSVLEAIQTDDSSSMHNGKSVEVTILFSDIRNFTGITENNPPEKVFLLLNEFFGGIEPVIRQNNGRVDKYIGDAVMAVFHQSSPEHHALSAIKAAFAMKNFVKKLNQKRSNEKLFTINIGIGISTGNVLLGDIGSERRKDLTVIGDEVNLASRLESASKKGQHSRIIISGSTLPHVESHVTVEHMPFTEIRGKQHAVEVYELVRLKAET